MSAAVSGCGTELRMLVREVRSLAFLKGSGKLRFKSTDALQARGCRTAFGFTHTCVILLVGSRERMGTLALLDWLAEKALSAQSFAETL